MSRPAVIAATIVVVIVVGLSIKNPVAVRSYFLRWDGDTIPSARESTLRDNLFTLRSLIDQYTLDKQHAPESLQDLVRDGYLKEIPTDPVTGRPDWEPQFMDIDIKTDIARRGIVDVHSRSSKRGSDGRAYSEW